MMTLISFLCLGFFLGMRHATDADHVVAVSTIVSREHTIKKAACIGAIWGIGHTLTVVLVGSSIILFGVVVPTRLGQSLELSVAFMLILLGFLNFRSFARFLRQTGRSDDRQVKSELHHARDHELELENHEGGEQHGRRFNARFLHLSEYGTLRPLGVGIVHGLAGSAAVALLALPLIKDPIWAIAYLLVFGVGTIGGMMLITAAIALPFSYARQRSVTFHHRLGFAAGFLSVGVGLFLVYQIGFVDGLFTK